MANYTAEWLTTCTGTGAVFYDFASDLMPDVKYFVLVIWVENVKREILSCSQVFRAQNPK